MWSFCGIDFPTGEEVMKDALDGIRAAARAAEAAYVYETLPDGGDDFEASGAAREVRDAHVLAAALAARVAVNQYVALMAALLRRAGLVVRVDEDVYEGSGDYSYDTAWVCRVEGSVFYTFKTPAAAAAAAAAAEALATVLMGEKIGEFYPRVTPTAERGEVVWEGEIYRLPRVGQRMPIFYGGMFRTAPLALVDGRWGLQRDRDGEIFAACVVGESWKFVTFSPVHIVDGVLFFTHEMVSWGEEVEIDAE